MIPKIICHKNKGYKWFTSPTCKFKGYLQKQDGSIVRDNNAIDFLKSIASFEEFMGFLKQCSGVFSLIIINGKEVWLATDIARTMPLYYTTDLKFVSDDVDSLRSVADENFFELDVIRTLELYTTSYVGFKNTVFCGIKQLELGCVARITNGTIIEKPYFTHHF